MANITLKKMYVTNFMSFGPDTQTYDFKAKGLSLILGKNKDDKSSFEASNGGGKSSFFIIAPLFCFFGDTDKKVKADDVVNNIMEKNCSVIIDFDVDGIPFRIERYRLHDKYKNQVFLYKNYKGRNDKEDLTKTTNSLTQEVIDSIVGDCKTFLNSIIFSQELLVNFLKLRAGERKEIVEKILQLEKLNSIQETLKEKYFIISGKRDKVGSDIATIKHEITTKDGAIDTYKQECESQARQNAKDMEQINRELAEINKMNIDELKKTKEEYEKSVLDYNSFKPYFDTKNKMIQDYVDDCREDNKTFNKLKRMKKDVDEHMKHPDKCPVCENQIDKEKFEKFINKQRDEMKSVLDSLKENKKKHDDLKAEIKKNYIKYGRKEMAEKTSLVKTLKLKMDKSKNFYDIMDNIDIKKQELEEKKKDKEKTFKDIYNENYVKKMKVEIEELKNKLPFLTEEKKSYEDELINYEFLIESLNLKNDKGLKNYIILTNLPVINQRLEYYALSVFSYPMTIKFDAQFNETIIMKNKQIAFENLSGGEKQRINLIINLTLFDLVRLNFNKINILMLDEIFDSLDKAGIQSFTSILKTISESYAVHLISHNGWVKGTDNIEDSKEQLKDLFDDIIVVEKENGFSKLKIY